MKRKFKAGLTSLSLPVIVYDNSSTTGAGLSGLDHATSGLVLEYRRASQSTWTSVTLVSKTLGTYVSGGIVASGSRAGRYEVDIPDAAIAAGARMVEVCLRGAANMHPVDIEIELDAVDYQDAAAFGLSRLGDIETDTQDIQLRIPAALVDGRIAANAQVVGDKTDYGLSSASLSSVATSVWSAGTRTLTGFGTLVSDVATAVWSAATRTLTAFGFNVNLTPSTGLGTQNGSVALVTKVEELGANALTANGAVDAIPTAVFSALTTATWPNNSFGKQILIGSSTQRAVAVTGSHHVAAVLHDAEPNSIPEDAFVSGALSARVIATDAIDSDAMAASANTEIANAVAATQALSRLDSMIESDGAGQFRFDTIALEQAPAGGGGGGTDWTANERTAIRAILGVPTSGTTPTDPTSGILDEIRDQTALITSGGTVNVSTPVTATGQLASPLIIGDDYLAANGRRFRWTVALPSGYVIATSTARFGMRYEDDEGVNEFIATGTVTDATGGNVHLDFDVAKTVTGTLRPGWYQWSVEIVSATGAEITRVKSGKNVEWQEKQT